MNYLEKIELRTELEEQLSAIVKDFEIKTGLVLDEISLSFGGVRVDLLD